MKFPFLFHEKAAPNGKLRRFIALKNTATLFVLLNFEARNYNFISWQQFSLLLIIGIFIVQLNYFSYVLYKLKISDGFPVLQHSEDVSNWRLENLVILNL